MSKKPKYLIGSSSQRLLPSEDNLRKRLKLIKEDGRSEPHIQTDRENKPESSSTRTRVTEKRSVRSKVTEAEMRCCLESTRHLENLKNPYYRLAVEEHLFK